MSFGQRVIYCLLSFGQRAIYCLLPFGQRVIYCQLPLRNVWFIVSRHSATLVIRLVVEILIAGIGQSKENNNRYKNHNNPVLFTGLLQIGAQRGARKSKFVSQCTNF